MSTAHNMHRIPNIIDSFSPWIKFKIFRENLWRKTAANGRDKLTCEMRKNYFDGSTRSPNVIRPECVCVCVYVCWLHERSVDVDTSLQRNHVNENISRYSKQKNLFLTKRKILNTDSIKFVARRVELLSSSDDGRDKFTRHKCRFTVRTIHRQWNRSNSQETQTEHRREKGRAADDGRVGQTNNALKSALSLSIKSFLNFCSSERYRDLLQAADTIAEMRSTSADVMRHIAEIISSCKIVNEQQLLGLKPSPAYESISANANVPSDRDHEHSCIGQIHLLTLLPELIWTQLDDGNYFVATQLFIFSRHISTGLQLDTTIDIFKRFPIARRQWNHLNQFFFVIKQKCLEQLEKPVLTAETAVKCLASLLLLDGCQLDQLLAIFIQSRTRAFRQTLSKVGRDDGDGQKVYRAKDRVLASLKILNETIELLFTCFIDSVDATKMETNERTNLSYLMTELERITGPNAKPTISLMNIENSMIVRVLPSLVAKFKWVYFFFNSIPNVNSSLYLYLSIRPQLQIKSIEPSAIKRVLSAWIEGTEADSKQCLKNVIDNVGSIRAIHNINQAVADLGECYLTSLG